MIHQDYKATILAHVWADEVYKKISHVRIWWTGNMEGSSENKGDIFTVTFGKTFVTFRIEEAVPCSRIVWKVLDSHLDWLKEQEWNNTTIIFDILEQGAATAVNMTHVGLQPGTECYDTCRQGWDFYIKESLSKLLSTGEGLPQLRKVLQ